MPALRGLGEALWEVRGSLTLIPTRTLTLTLTLTLALALTLTLALALTLTKRSIAGVTIESCLLALTLALTETLTFSAGARSCGRCAGGLGIRVMAGEG